MTPCSRIFFPAWFTHNGETRCERADFTLGDGPCGKSVSALSFVFGEGCLSILQDHTDGTTKRIVYPLHTLAGRIEIEP